jgi:uncharacterized protein (DUF697 family)
VATKKVRANMIIHAAAISAGSIGAGLAQIPTSDNLLITPIQLAMIAAVAKIQGKTLEEASGPTLLSSLSASAVGRGVSQIAVGWIPMYGNAVNAATAFAITEAIGWTAFKYFESDEKAS